MLCRHICQCHQSLGGSFDREFPATFVFEHITQRSFSFIHSYLSVCDHIYIYIDIFYNTPSNIPTLRIHLIISILFPSFAGIMTLSRGPYSELDKMSLFQDLKLKRRKVDSRCSSDGESLADMSASSPDLLSPLSPKSCEQGGVTQQQQQQQHCNFVSITSIHRPL